MGLLRVVLKLAESGARFRGALLAGLLALLITIRKIRNQALRPSFAVAKSIPLLREERTLICLSLPAVTTVTFYRNTSGVSPAEFLRERTAEIVRANPWLAGRLLDTASDGGLCIAVPADLDTPCFEEFSESRLRPGMSFEELVLASK